MKNSDTIKPVNKMTFNQKLLSYKKHPLSFVMLFLVLLATTVTIGVLMSIVIHILVTGIPNLSAKQFEIEYTSDNVSMLPAIINTLIMILLTLIIAVPIGVFSAIYLVEYAKKDNKLVKAIRITAETLSGIPSIVYGLFGYLMFVTALKMQYSLIAGALTLSIMVLPLIMRTTEEALIAVPNSYREGSFGLGAGKLRTVFKVILPTAIPSILQGVILSIGRIVGETAGLIYTAGTGAQIVESLNSSGRTLSVHMYMLFCEGMHIEKMASTAVVLLIIVFVINSISSILARKLEVKSKG